MELSDDLLERLLDAWAVARLATVSADGHPHIVPIVFCHHQGVIYSPLDGKRKDGRRLQRLTNIDGNPSVTVLLDDYDTDWQRLWWVRIDGCADRFEPARRLAATLAERLLAKYPQYQDPELMFDRDEFVRVEPVRISAWTQAGTPTPIEAAAAGPR